MSGPHDVPALQRLLDIGQAAPGDEAQPEGGRGWLPLAAVLGAPLPTRRGWLGRHWHGDLPLAQAYWINTFGLSVLLAAAVAILVALVPPEGETLTPAALLLGALVLGLIPVTAWQVVGTWRAADRHPARGGRAGWAIAAKAVLILGTLRAVTELGMAAITARNAWTVASLVAALPDTEVFALRGGTEVMLAGGIRAGTTTRLRAVLAENPRARVLHLSSPGGLLAEGHAMAALVREARLDTYVPARCNSACTIVFLAGRERWLGPAGRLGFHAPTPVAAGTEGAALVARERQHLVSLGLPPGFVEQAFAARGAELWQPSAQQALEARAATRIATGREFSPGRPSPPATLEAAQASLRQDMLGRALERAAPATFATLAERLRDGLNDGARAEDLLPAVEQSVAPLYAQVLPRLPDRVMVATVRATVQAAQALAAADPRLCRDWLLWRPGQPLVPVWRVLSPPQRDSLAGAMAEALLAGADPARRAAPPAREPPALAVVFRRLQARLPRSQMAALETLEDVRQPPQPACAAALELFAEIMRLPEAEAGPLMRFLLAAP